MRPTSVLLILGCFALFTGHFLLGVGLVAAAITWNIATFTKD